MKNLGSLKELDISGCIALRRMTDELLSLENLEALRMQGCVLIPNLPDRIDKLAKLGTLILWDCKGLRALPSSMSAMHSLHSLDVDGCVGLVQLPDLSQLVLKVLRVYVQNTDLGSRVTADPMSADRLNVVAKWSRDSYLAYEADAQERTASDKQVELAKLEALEAEADAYTRDVLTAPSRDAQVELLCRWLDGTYDERLRALSALKTARIHVSVRAECAPFIIELLNTAPLDNMTQLAARIALFNLPMTDFGRLYSPIFDDYKAEDDLHFIRWSIGLATKQMIPRQLLVARLPRVIERAVEVLHTHPDALAIGNLSNRIDAIDLMHWINAVNELARPHELPTLGELFGAWLNGNENEVCTALVLMSFVKPEIWIEKLAAQVARLATSVVSSGSDESQALTKAARGALFGYNTCLLYTSPSPRDS